MYHSTKSSPFLFLFLSSLLLTSTPDPIQKEKEKKKKTYNKSLNLCLICAPLLHRGSLNKSIYTPVQVALFAFARMTHVLQLYCNLTAIVDFAPNFSFESQRLRCPQRTAEVLYTLGVAGPGSPVSQPEVQPGAGQGVRFPSYTHTCTQRWPQLNRELVQTQMAPAVWPRATQSSTV